jgi:hypothetical protein
MESPNTPPTVNGNHPPINQGQDSQAAVNGDVGSGVSESSVSDVSVQPDNRVTVIYHFEATNANEMTIAPGDILVVVEKAETGVYYDLASTLYTMEILTKDVL